LAEDAEARDFFLQKLIALEATGVTALGGVGTWADLDAIEKNISERILFSEFAKATSRETALEYMGMLEDLKGLEGSNGVAAGASDTYYNIVPTDAVAWDAFVTSNGVAEDGALFTKAYADRKIREVKELLVWAAVH